MKKTLTILMILLAMSATVFAEVVSFQANEGWMQAYYTFDVGFVVTDTDYEQKDFTGCTDTEIEEYIRNITEIEMGEKLNSHAVSYIFCGGFIHDDVSRLAKKFFKYWIFNKDETYLNVVWNLGDGREMRLIYRIDKEIYLCD